MVHLQGKKLVSTLEKKKCFLIVFYTKKRGENIVIEEKCHFLIFLDEVSKKKKKNLYF